MTTLQDLLEQIEWASKIHQKYRPRLETLSIMINERRWTEAIQLCDKLWNEVRVDSTARNSVIFAIEAAEDFCFREREADGLMGREPTKSLWDLTVKDAKDQVPEITEEMVMKAKVEDLKKNPEKLKDVARKAGIIDEQGDLKPEYGGNPKMQTQNDLLIRLEMVVRQNVAYWPVLGKIRRAVSDARWDDAIAFCDEARAQARDPKQVSQVGTDFYSIVQDIKDFAISEVRKKPQMSDAKDALIYAYKSLHGPKNPQISGLDKLLEEVEKESAAEGKTEELEAYKQHYKLVADTLKETMTTPYHKVAQEVADLVVEKQAAYGDSFSKSGNIMRILYPEGIPPEAMDDALMIVRMVDKFFRIAQAKGSKDPMGEDPCRDLVGYSLLGVVRGLRGDKR